MYEYQLIVDRANDLRAEAARQRLLREVRRAKKAGGEDDRRRPRRH
jgi:hypothetical protein